MTVVDTGSAPVSMSARAALLPLTIVAAVAIWVLAIAQPFHVNPDGSGYLAIAWNLRHGNGFVFPDGSAVTFRGPLYPAVLGSIGLLPGDDVDAAMVASRLVLVINAALVGSLAWRLTRSRAAIFVAALPAAFSSIVVQSGARYLVPDGLAMLFVLTAAHAVVTAVVRRGLGWWIVAGAALVAAVLTKETAALLLLAALAAWIVAHRQSRLLAVGVAAAAGLLAFAALRVTGPRSPDPVSSALSAIAEMLRREGFRLYPQALALLAVVLVGLFGWAAWASVDVRVRLVLPFVSVGLAITAYAALIDYGSRNALPALYAVALMLGVLTDAAPGGRRTTRVAGVVVAALLVAAGLPATTQLSSNDRSAVSWDSPPVRAAADWLDEHARAEHVGGSFYYMSSLWWLSKGTLDLTLIPMFAADAHSPSLEHLDYAGRVTWLAHTDARPSGNRVVMLTRSTREIGVVYEEDLLEHLRRTDARYVVLSGIANGFPKGATFDAGLLLPYFERHDAFQPVYSTSEHDLPVWIVIYEVTGPLSPNSTLVPHAASTVAPIELPASFVVVDRDRYLELLYEVLPR